MQEKSSHDFQKKETAPQHLPVLEIKPTPKEPEAKPEILILEQEQKQIEEKIKETKSLFPQQTQFDTGFFSEFEQFLNEKDFGEKLIEELVNKDLLGKMKQFHAHKKAGKPFFFHTDELQKALYTKLAELKKLEREWFLRQKELESYENLVLDKESEIDIRIEELKQILKELKAKAQFEKQLKPNEYFYCTDGKIFKNLHEFKKELKLMPDSVFKYHVDGQKNDFANWIRFVFKNNEFADKIKSATSKEELAKILEAI